MDLRKRMAGVSRVGLEGVVRVLCRARFLPRVKPFTVHAASRLARNLIAHPRLCRVWFHTAVRALGVGDGDGELDHQYPRLLFGTRPFGPVLPFGFGGAFTPPGLNGIGDFFPLSQLHLLMGIPHFGHLDVMVIPSRLRSGKLLRLFGTF